MTKSAEPITTDQVIRDLEARREAIVEEVASLDARRDQLLAEEALLAKAWNMLNLGDQLEVPETPPVEPKKRAKKGERKKPVKLTSEDIRDWAVEVKSFSPREAMAHFNVSHPTFSRRVKPLVEKGILKVTGEKASRRYEYNPKAPSGPTSRPRQMPPELEVARSKGAPTAPRTRPVKTGGLRVRTNNKELNGLLEQVQRSNHALIERSGDHLRIKFPNGGLVRVSSTPDPSAINLIKRDLDHAASGRFALISQGGGPYR